MELKLDSWYSKWFSFVYLTDKKPKTVCELFWKLVASPFVWILGNPLWIFAFIWRKWTKRNVDWEWMLIPMLFNIIFLIAPEESHWYIRLINGWIVLFFLVITACVVILISVGIIFLIEKIKERKTFKSKNIVGQRVKDFKNKTCTLIKWK